MAGPVRLGAAPSLADNFSARPETAADLGTALAAGAVVVLTSGRAAGEGPGRWLESCGKTQLAVCVADSLCRSGRVDLVVWVTAASRASLLSGFAEAAAAALRAGPCSDGESAAARFVHWLGETSRPWLVVLDDLRDAADLEGLWPKGPAGRVLVTTANPAGFPRAAGALIHPVGAYRPGDALNYLTARLAAEPGQQAGAVDLAQDLGCEPLALAQASAVIASSAQSCRDYRDLFARRREQLAEAAAGPPPAASVTWAISAEQADLLSPGGAARALLELAALLDGHGIPAAVFTTPAACGYLPGDGPGLAAGERAGQALRAAQRAGLLSADLEGTAAMVRMSAVVQTAIREVMPAGMLDRAAVAAAGALLQAWPGDEQPAGLAAALRSCVASLQRSAGDRLWAGGSQLLLRAGQSLGSARLTGPAVAYGRDLAVASSRILGRGHPDTLAAGQQLAAAYAAAGQAEEAVSQFRWVLAERIRVLGPDHPSAIAARRDLGNALVAAGQFGDAIAVLGRVVSDCERVRGPDQLDTLGARDELAAAYLAAGQFADAIPLYRRTVTSRERTQGMQHPDTMTTRQKLAGAYLADGNFKIALFHYKRVLADRERVLGPDHLDTIALRGTLGAAYSAAGRMASALQLHEQARAGYERALGAEHRDTLTSSVILAHACYAAGRVTDALNLLRDTLVHCEQSLPPGDPLTETVRQSLTNIAG